MATFELPRAVNSTGYLEEKDPVGVTITKVTDGESGSELNVGDSVTVTFINSSTGREGTFEATFIGTMTVTVSGETQTFMVVEQTVFGDDNQYVVGLKVADAPTTIVKTGNSANFSADSFTVCFFPGTLIATPSGERRVEDLAPGDLVLIEEGRSRSTWIGRMNWKLRRKLGFGRAVPVKWLGRKTLSTRFGPAERLMPERFSTGSLGGDGGGGGNLFCRIAN